MLVNRRPAAFVIIVGLLLMVAVQNDGSSQQSQQNLTVTEPVSVPVADTNATDMVLAETSGQFDDTIISTLNDLINQQPGLDVAVSIIDFETGSQYNAGLTQANFKAASTAKLMTAASYLYEVQAGRASIDQVIDGISAQSLIKQLLEVSDNTAWDSLRNYLGDRQQAFARLVGIESFVGGDINTITAADQAKLLAVLYEGNLLNSNLTSIIFEHMAAADAEDLIKAAMPADAVVLHKYGTLWGNLHDVALVNHQGRRFALVIFTNDARTNVVSYADRAAFIRQLAQAVRSAVKVPQPSTEG
jgi:beta-lactamase class A